MKTRVMSSIAIGVILLVVLLCGGYVMAAVLLMLSLIAYFELMRATGVHQAEKKCSGIEMAGYIGIIFHYGLMLFMGKDIRFFGLSILFVFFAVMIVYVLTFPKYQAQQAMAAIFSFVRLRPKRVLNASVSACRVSVRFFCKKSRSASLYRMTLTILLPNHFRRGEISAAVFGF